jgi:hypothetical protein
MVEFVPCVSFFMKAGNLASRLSKPDAFLKRRKVM